MGLYFDDPECISNTIIIPAGVLVEIFYLFQGWYSSLFSYKIRTSYLAEAFWIRGNGGIIEKIMGSLHSALIAPIGRWGMFPTFKN